MQDQLVERYIRTKSKLRKIVTYVDDNCELRQQHEKIVRIIRSVAYPSLFAKAYVSGRGIFDNAKAHMYNDIFIKFDIKDFFNSINHDKLEECLYRELKQHSRVKEADDFTEEIDHEFTKGIVEICSCGYDGLPLGLVPSPDLANLYLKKFDGLLYGKLKTYNVENVIYTRYADDLTISFKYHPEYRHIVDQMRADVIDYLEEFFLKLNDKKTSVVNLMETNHVRITGVSIIKKEDNYRRISVGKKLKNEVFWKAIEIFDTPEEERKSEEVKRLKGMLSFILSIEKEGISFTYSRNMRQLIYDRGYRNLPELVKTL